MFTLFFVLLSGCCRNEIPPILDTPQFREAEANDIWSVPLTDIILDSSLSLDELTIQVQSSNPEVIATIEDEWLTLRPTSTPFNDTTSVEITVYDQCDEVGVEIFDVQFGTGDASNNTCTQSFVYEAPAGTTAVFIAGDFNEWNTTSHPLTQLNNRWSIDLQLETETAYKFVVEHEGQQQWTCDPNGDWFQCDPNQTFENTCELGSSSCNSIATPQCTTYVLEIEDWEIVDTTILLSLQSEQTLETINVEYNGIIDSYNWTSTLSIPLQNVDRHTITITGISTDGDASSPIHLPFWTDDFDWNSAVMYFPFVDRFANGDPTNDLEYETNWPTGDYLGGDWQGIIDNLDYLDAMGVNALWINSPLDNPSGTFEGSCGMSITGYHGYWPQSNSVLEEHFGSAETLHTLIEESHNRGIRVLIDWVGNHTHDQHPWFEEHPNWYTTEHLCMDNDNWNQAPETCWFAPYVPTIDYSHPSPTVKSVEDIISFAIEYNIDGLRVDAVKHMPKAVHWNLQRQIDKHIEHSSTTPFDFYTVGETFSGDRELLREYLGPDLLDGQFDFALYWKILEVLARNEGELIDLEIESQQSLSFFDEHTMSNFLGNHDVERFISHASGDVSSLYGDGLCSTGEWRVDAESPDWDEPYQRLKLAWTWLLTHPGATLMYYGDEIGLPGYHDPDNRQLMQWDWNTRQASVQSLVQTISLARQLYPQLTSKNRTVWWESSDTLAISMSQNNQYALIVINRSGQPQTLTNGLSWAGLPSVGTVREILTEQNVTLIDDELTFTIPAFTSQVWIWEW